MQSAPEKTSLAGLTSLGIGGPADVVHRPLRAGDAQKILDLASGDGFRPRILGGGTNILVDDEGVRGPVISTRALTGMFLLPGNRVRAEAGCRLSTLLRRTAQWGLSGLESLAGIPGTVGGAVVMNAGAGGGAICDAVYGVEAALPGRGLHRIARAEIPFAYRRSGLQGRLVVAVTFRLNPDAKTSIRRRMREWTDKRRKSQPLGVKSAGCFFRNAGRVPAGLLIDRAGLKGLRIGGAMISPIHANFIVNVGGACSQDVLALAKIARDAVLGIYGIRLRAEVRYWKSGTRIRIPRETATVQVESPGTVEGMESPVGTARVSGPFSER